MMKDLKKIKNEFKVEKLFIKERIMFLRVCLWSSSPNDNNNVRCVNTDGTKNWN